MYGVKAQLKDGTQVRILEVVTHNKPVKNWTVNVVNNNNEVFSVNASQIQILGGT